MATQADLSPDRGAVGRGGGEERVPVRVEFTENSLTYMDRLLLKKHRRYTDREKICMHLKYMILKHAKASLIGSWHCPMRSCASHSHYP